MCSAIAIGEAIASVVLLHVGYVWLALIRQAQGAPDEAHLAMARVEALDAALPPWQAQGLLDYGYAYYQLGRNDLGAATAWASARRKQLFVQAPPATDALDVITAVVAQRTLQAVQAEQLLTPALAAARVDERPLAATRLHVLRALVRAAADHPSAVTDLRQALALAAPERYVRAFLDAGTPVADMLVSLSHQSLEPPVRAFVAGLLTAFGVAPDATPRTAAPPPASVLIDALNERERTVLRLIAEGRSNAEIAEHLIVALSTVKWHIGNLYGKLGVKTRTRALARAAELGLL
ncbi:MAG: hypothetical protein H7Y32_13065 [Chloroflexales bacterium]|nr:hypothetical protein [Chloroflexales bacterium]